MSKLRGLLESIHKDAGGGSKVIVESMGGSKAKVIVDGEVVDVVEFEPGDDIIECLSQYND